MGQHNILDTCRAHGIKVEHGVKGRPRPRIRGPAGIAHQQLRRLRCHLGQHPRHQRRLPHIRHPRADQIPRRDLFHMEIRQQRRRHILCDILGQARRDMGRPVRHKGAAPHARHQNPIIDQDAVRPRHGARCHPNTKRQITHRRQLRAGLKLPSQHTFTDRMGQSLVF